VDPACSPGEGAEETSEARTSFVVDAVAPEYLELRTVAGMDPGVCWPAGFQYQVMVRNAWLVWSSLDGVLGRTGMQPWQDPVPDPRAYDNGRIQFTLFAPARTRRASLARSRAARPGASAPTRAS
jgi:hypothetical protein